MKSLTNGITKLGSKLDMHNSNLNLQQTERSIEASIMNAPLAPIKLLA